MFCNIHFGGYLDHCTTELQKKGLKAATIINIGLVVIVAIYYFFFFLDNSNIPAALVALLLTEITIIPTLVITVVINRKIAEKPTIQLILIGYFISVFAFLFLNKIGPMLMIITFFSIQLDMRKNLY
ncbi:hypothetical protein RZE82_01815 [Mollicutes bacterium LVI A0039]|nr:hypothetical protein RZE82_01815 [Mollicutes bacterium LVI A0039]